MVGVARNQSALKVGVLALQGAFARHQKVFHELSVDAFEVRTPADLEKVDALVMQGGESTTMSHLLESSHLFEPITKRLKEGLQAILEANLPIALTLSPSASHRNSSAIFGLVGSNTMLRNTGA